jgi:hypothetical protein
MPLYEFLTITMASMLQYPNFARKILDCSSVHEIELFPNKGMAQECSAARPGNWPGEAPVFYSTYNTVVQSTIFSYSSAMSDQQPPWELKSGS